MHLVLEMEGRIQILNASKNIPNAIVRRRLPISAHQGLATVMEDIDYSGPKRFPVSITASGNQERQDSFCHGQRRQLSRQHKPQLESKSAQGRGSSGEILCAILDPAPLSTSLFKLGPTPASFYYLQNDSRAVRLHSRRDIKDESNTHVTQTPSLQHLHRRSLLSPRPCAF